MEKKKRIIKYDNSQFSISENVNVYSLDTIQNAIEYLLESGEKEATINLTLADLHAIRRLLVLDCVSTALSRDNLVEILNNRIDKN